MIRRAIAPTPVTSDAAHPKATKILAASGTGATMVIALPDGSWWAAMSAILPDRRHRNVTRWPSESVPLRGVIASIGPSRHPAHGVARDTGRWRSARRRHAQGD